MQLKWGYVPASADSPKEFAPINAKSDTVAELPTFREFFRLCLMPATVFYEWETERKKKRPVHFR